MWRVDNFLYHRETTLRSIASDKFCCYYESLFIKKLYIELSKDLLIC